MKKENQPWLRRVLLCIVMMFVWIFVTVALTGGREMSDFNSRDWAIFAGFMILELATLVVLCVTLKKQFDSGKKSSPQPPKEKPRPLWIAAQVATFLLVLGAVCLGIVVRPGAGETLRTAAKWVLTASYGLCLLIPLNLCLTKRLQRRLEGMDVGDMQEYIASHRQQAEETSRIKLAQARRWRRSADLLAWVLFLAGLLSAFCVGLLLDNATVFVLLSLGLCLAGVQRLRLPVKRHWYRESEAYVSPEEYLHIYMVARRAARVVGCREEIHIAFVPDCSAGIARIGSTCSVQLGVILLRLFSEEELYHVLLHEFAHLAGEDRLLTAERRYFQWLSSGGNSHWIDGITDLFYLYADAQYALAYNLYQYAASVLIETAADRAMADHGDAETAASALLKLKYYELFQWEDGTCDEPCELERTEPDRALVQRRIEDFEAALAKRQEDWDRLALVEILSRSASHPTLPMRLAALGVSEPRLVERSDGEPYRKECEKALTHVEMLLWCDRKETYEERRRAGYLEPLALVEAWEQAGKPVVAEEYADVVQSLQGLGRNMEAVALCRRAVAELPPIAAAFGEFFLGCFLLHSYDPAGIEHIYRAMEENNNYLDEGLETIGAFCCLVGDQQALDEYRARAVDFARKGRAESDPLSDLTKKDDLSAEQLPEGMLEDILQHILAAADGCLDTIYLVRKTVSPTYFASVFVLRFGTEDEEVKGQVLHKTFRYLDTCSDWQFALFDYDDVIRAGVDKIPGSVVYEKKQA